MAISVRAVKPPSVVPSLRLGELRHVARHTDAIHAALVLAAIGLWAGGLAGTDVSRMTDLGLVSVLPAGYYLALSLLTVSFCVAVCSPTRHWALLAAHLVALLLMLHGTPAILYGTARYAWVWKHAGIVDAIIRHGRLSFGAGAYSAYQDWPGFFGLAALIVRIGGFGGALAFASWAPLFYNLLFAAAAMFVFRSMTDDRRLAWLAVWIFALTSWVGQDYFSPQATAFFLYLVFIGVCLRWLVPVAGPRASARLGRAHAGRLVTGLRNLITWGRSELSTAVPVSGRQALVAVEIVLAAAIVTSHQLTPFMLILVVIALAVFQLSVMRGMPALVIVLAGAWAIYMSVGFLKGNLYWIVDSIGTLNIGGSTLSNLAAASPDHLIVANAARLLTIAMAVLAIAGITRRVWRGHVDLAAVLLAAAPVLMVWGNAYGGEILFRIYFFALPFLAFLVAGLVFPTRAPRSWIRGMAAVRDLEIAYRRERLGDADVEAEPPELVADRRRRLPAWLIAIALCAPLLAGMMLAYYGNERANHFSRDEVRSAQYLISHAPAGSRFVGLATTYPWAFRNAEHYTYVWVSALRAKDQRAVIVDPIHELSGLIGRRGPGYVVFSKSQEAEIEMTGILPPDSVPRIEAAVATSPLYHEVYRGPDAQIFERAGGA